MASVILGPVVAAAGPQLAAADAGGLTSYSYSSAPGDWVGKGQSGTYTLSDATFSLSGTSGGIWLEVSGADGSWWQINIVAPSGQQLTPGVYPGATRDRAGSGSILDVAGSGAGCNQVFGSFTIYAITADSTGAVTTFDASFTQHCESATAPALTGTVQYNAPSPAPVVETLSSSSVVAGEPVSAAAYVTPPGGQAPSGSVTFTDGTKTLGRAAVDSDGFASLALPPLAVGSHDIVALYSNGPTGCANATSCWRSRAQLTVNPSDTSFFMVSPSHDYVGGGATFSYWTSNLALPDSSPSFSMGGNPTRVTISVQSASHWWYINLAAPADGVLLPGTYTGAERAGFQTGSAPGLDVYGDGRGCNTVAGSFVIRSIVADPSGVIGELDASFTESCEGFMPSFSGTVKYHTGRTP